MGNQVFLSMCRGRPAFLQHRLSKRHTGSGLGATQGGPKKNFSEMGGKNDVKQASCAPKALCQEGAEEAQISPGPGRGGGQRSSLSPKPAAVLRRLLCCNKGERERAVLPLRPPSPPRLSPWPANSAGEVGPRSGSQGAPPRRNPSVAEAGGGEGCRRGAPRRDARSGLPARSKRPPEGGRERERAQTGCLHEAFPHFSCPARRKGQAPPPLTNVDPVGKEDAFGPQIMQGALTPPFPYLTVGN